MQDFEKLGVFYLGKTLDPETKASTGTPLLYESKDLMTHAVCVGMTGSGKTGLCIWLLEEAAIDGIPAIAIDPKGDIANLLLTFPELRPGRPRGARSTGRVVEAEICTEVCRPRRTKAPGRAGGRATESAAVPGLPADGCFRWHRIAECIPRTQGDQRNNDFESDDRCPPGWALLER